MSQQTCGQCKMPVENEVPCQHIGCLLDKITLCSSVCSTNHWKIHHPNHCFCCGKFVDCSVSAFDCHMTSCLRCSAPMCDKCLFLGDHVRSHREERYHASRRFENVKLETSQHASRGDHIWIEDGCEREYSPDEIALYEKTSDEKWSILRKLSMDLKFYLKTQKDNTNGDIIQPTEALTFPDGNGQPLYPNLTQ